jgi:hypothetical protein
MGLRGMRSTIVEDCTSIQHRLVSAAGRGVITNDVTDLDPPVPIQLKLKHPSKDRCVT